LQGEINDGSNDAHGGYTMLGRLYAVGYMRGLLEAAQKVSATKSEKENEETKTKDIPKV